jgi:hypothetical protein
MKGPAADLVSFAKDSVSYERTFNGHVEEHLVEFGQSLVAVERRK